MNDVAVRLAALASHAEPEVRERVGAEGTRPKQGTSVPVQAMTAVLRTQAGAIPETALASLAAKLGWSADQLRMGLIDIASMGALEAWDLPAFLSAARAAGDVAHAHDSPSLADSLAVIGGFLGLAECRGTLRGIERPEHDSRGWSRERQIPQSWRIESSTGSAHGWPGFCRACLANGRGEYRDALRAASEIYHDGTGPWAAHALEEMVEAGSRAGEAPAAEDALVDLRTRVRRSDTSWGRGVLARAEALMAPDRYAEDLYTQALSLLTNMGLATAAARTHLVYAEWLRRQRRRIDARTHLRQAQQTFPVHVRKAFAPRIEVELAATGIHARKRTATSRLDLTPQESRITELAAAGATNADIATQLFIRESTVEYHLTKAFRKLGIQSRRQLRGTRIDMARVP